MLIHGVSQTIKAIKKPAAEKTSAVNSISNPKPYLSFLCYHQLHHPAARLTILPLPIALIEYLLR